MGSESQVLWRRYGVRRANLTLPEPKRSSKSKSESQNPPWASTHSPRGDQAALPRVHSGECPKGPGAQVPLPLPSSPGAQRSSLCCPVPRTRVLGPSPDTACWAGAPNLENQVAKGEERVGLDLGYFPKLGRKADSAFRLRSHPDSVPRTIQYLGKGMEGLEPRRSPVCVLAARS